MATKTYLGGKAELAFGTNVIEPDFLGDITVNLAEGTRSVTSLAGVISKPSGAYETAEVTGNFILPSMDALKLLYAHIYEAPTGTGDLSGRVVFGGNTCNEQTPKVLNIHYTCESNSDNDFHANAALIHANFNPTYNTDGTLTVPFTILLQPDDNGEYGFAGAGDLTKKTLWDAATLSYVDVPVSA